MNKLIIAGVVAAVGIGGYAAYGFYSNQSDMSSAASADAIPLYTVQEGQIEVSLSTIGELNAAKSVVLSTPFEGKITQLVPEGTRVAEGDPVIWFETEDLEQQFDDQEAQLALDEKNLQAAKEAAELEEIKNQYTLESERTKVAIARQSFEDRKQKYEAEQILFDKNISPQTKLSEARLSMLQAELELRNAQINLSKVEENLASNLRVKERDIEKARLTVEKTQRKVDEAEEKIDKAVVRATSPGDISYLKIWKSGKVAKIAEGDQVWRRSALVEIPDTSEMHAVVPINEIDISRVEKGQRAEVELTAKPGTVFQAEVVSKSIVPITDPTKRSWDTSGEDRQGPREFEVRVKLLESDEAFRQGMTVSARIILESEDAATLVPLEAVHESGEGEGVWKKTPAGPTFVPVRISMTNDDYAAVVGSISPSDQVYLGNPRPNDALPLLGLGDDDTEPQEAASATASDVEADAS